MDTMIRSGFTIFALQHVLKNDLESKSITEFEYIKLRSVIPFAVNQL